MAEFFGAIMRGLGAALNGLYSVVPSYGLAIILLTIFVRALLIPLAVKQVRSMTAMQKLQPELKAIQAKYKQLQKKVNDRVELQQLRMQQNQEVMALYKAHGVHPASGCLPMLAQMPVWIAMFSVLRASIVVVPAFVALSTGGAPSTDTFTSEELREVLCRPAVEPSAGGSSPSEISCETPEGPKTFSFIDPRRAAEAPRFILFREGTELNDTAWWVSLCRPIERQGALTFKCQSAQGTGHLPRDGKLFADVTRDRATFLGMHLSCNPGQAASPKRIAECTTRKSSEADAGTARAIPYYLLIAGIAFTQYYQGKQMMARSQATGPAAQQQALMTKFMPVMMVLISLSMPAGVLLYFLTSNIWQIGQQAIVYRKRDEAVAAPKAAAPAFVEDEVLEETPAPPRRPQSGSKKKKRKKRR